MKPRPVVILWVVSGDPNVELNGFKITWLFPCLCALLQLPESKSELMQI